MVDGKMNIIKYLMFFFNLLFWISGIVLIVIGSYLRDKYGEYLTFADNKYSDAAIFLIIIGVIVFIIGFLGCCGAIKENYCMVTTFAVLLTIIFILELAAGVLGFVYKGKVKTVADDTLQRALDEYPQEGAKDFYNFIQKELHCCGYKNATDWLNKHQNSSASTAAPATTAAAAATTAAANDANATTSAPTAAPTAAPSTTAAPAKTGIPDSCCSKPPCNTGNSYDVGCKDKFETFLGDQLLTIGGIGVGIAFLQILGIVFACLLMRSIKGEYEVV